MKHHKLTSHYKKIEMEGSAGTLYHVRIDIGGIEIYEVLADSKQEATEQAKSIVAQEMLPDLLKNAQITVTSL